jgi:hypothetical protein
VSSNAAVEKLIVDRLKADTVFTATFATVCQRNRVSSRPTYPMCALSLTFGGHEKELLDTYGGQATLQFDLWLTTDDDTVVALAIETLRTLVGTYADLAIDQIEVTNDFDWPVTDKGLYRWTVEADVDWKVA